MIACRERVLELGIDELGDSCQELERWPGDRQASHVVELRANGTVERRWEAARRIPAIERRVEQREQEPVGGCHDPDRGVGHQRSGLVETAGRCRLDVLVEQPWCAGTGQWHDGILELEPAIRAGFATGPR